MNTRTRLTALFVTICTLLAVGCEKEPIAQIDPNAYEATNALMGCKWVHKTINMIDDKARGTSYLLETIIFTSDSTAIYYYDYRGTHSQDDNQYTDTITYTVTASGSNGFAGETWMQSAGTHGQFQYDKHADAFVWYKTFYGLYCVVFLREK